MKLTRDQRREIYEELDREIQGILETKVEELNYLYDDQNRELQNAASIG
jgi:hypothetical protein